MHVTRLGFAVLKGTRHESRDRIELSTAGPVGDRVFCLLDVERDRVLHTVDHPTLLGVRGTWDGVRLGLRLPDGRTVAAEPVDAGRTRTADYWGRAATLRLQRGPHAAVLSAYLGREVVLARVDPGEVVYAGVVSIVGTAAIDGLAERANRPDLPTQDARFRATLTLAGPEPEPGSRIRVGEAVVEVLGRIPRCAVIDLDPVTGRRTPTLLTTLAGYGRGLGEPLFGVHGRVSVPGVVRTGDPAHLED